MKMRKKLYILEFTGEGFEKIGADDPNDDEGPTDITVDGDGKELDDTDRDLLKEEEQGFDELDLVNKDSTSNSVGSSKMTEAMSFHPAPLLAACSPQAWAYGKAAGGGPCE
ncbi:hypothetical protein D1007_46831 [Hordeum vulgare]|nr:hypothetical protein D1007_46831 [Hordeum vulgare]